MLAQIHARRLLIPTNQRRQPTDHEWRTWSRRFAIGAALRGGGLRGAFALLLLGWLAALCWLARRHAALLEEGVRRQFDEESNAGRPCAGKRDSGSALDRNQAFQ